MVRLCGFFLVFYSLNVSGMFEGLARCVPSGLFARAVEGLPAEAVGRALAEEGRGAPARAGGVGADWFSAAAHDIRIGLEAVAGQIGSLTFGQAVGAEAAGFFAEAARDVGATATNRFCRTVESTVPLVLLAGLVGFVGVPVCSRLFSVCCPNKSDQLKNAQQKLVMLQIEGIVSERKKQEAVCKNQEASAVAAHKERELQLIQACEKQEKLETILASYADCCKRGGNLEHEKTAFLIAGGSQKELDAVDTIFAESLLSYSDYVQ